MKNKGFGLIGILIGVVVVLLAGGGVYYSNINDGVMENIGVENVLSEGENVVKQVEENSDNTVGKVDETAGWKTYRNEEYGFSFAYPNSFSITSEGKNILGNQSWVRLEKNDNGGFIDLSIEENSSINLEAKEILYGPGKGINIDAKKIFVGERKAIVFDSSFEGAEQMTIYLPIGKHRLSITFSSLYSEYQKQKVKKLFIDDREVINKILSTFKFPK